MVSIVSSSSMREIREEVEVDLSSCAEGISLGRESDLDLAKDIMIVLTVGHAHLNLQRWRD